MSKSDYLVLIGPPNSGKTTLFNWMTGYRRQTVNYPHSTVDLSFGLIRQNQCKWKLIDTPGIYNLFSNSPESKVTQNILKDSLNSEEFRGIIVVIDSTHLHRQLPLVFQLKEQGWPVIVALSMYDIQKKVSPFNIDLLSKHIEAPVYPIEGLLGGGVPELVSLAQKQFANKISISHIKTDQGKSVIENSSKKINYATQTKKLQDKAPIENSSEEIHHTIQTKTPSWSEKKQDVFLKKAKTIIDKISIKNTKTKVGKTTKRLDKWLLHPLFGFGFLGLILFTFFSSIFWLAGPLMDTIDTIFSWAIEKTLSLGPNVLIMDFLANGVFTSFGAFFVFIPQVFILFLGIYILEDSGYLARAVTLVDGPFSRIGLSGKSLFPFLSGFACAIPATLSARSISSKRERWITIFVLPFMTCSARLPVYALLLSFLFYKDSAWKPGLIMALLYFLSLLLAIVAAGLLNFFMKTDKRSSFLMELPLYRRPVLSSVFISSWARTKHFILKAGPVIFTFALIMWLATHLPYSTNMDAEQRVQNSYAGKLGKMIEPVFEQMGGDWRVGLSLISAFVAREVFVSVLAVTLKNTPQETDPIQGFSKETQYANQTKKDQKKALIEESSEKTNTPYSLAQTMREVKTKTGEPLFSTASVLALLVFFMISLQCLSTTGIVYKETGSWKLATSQLVSLNLIAYISAVTTYHLLS